MNVKSTLFSILLLLSLSIISCKKEVVDPEPEIPISPTDSVGFNFSFEKWASTSLDGLVYEEPSGGYWTTLNYLSRLSCPITVSKTTDAQHGGFSACLETKQWGSMVIPGLLVMGTFIPEDPFIIQGKPYTERPTSVNGFYKYLPIDGDTCVLYARLSKYNTTLNKQDTIAEASITVNNNVPQFLPFSLIFDYRDPVSNPDSLTILFVSSIDGANFRGHPGSKLFVDNLALEYEAFTKRRIK